MRRVEACGSLDLAQPLGRAGTRSIEVDQLNVEVVLLGWRRGVPTPVNKLMQAVADELVAALD